jgi:hypothetical protein
MFGLVWKIDDQRKAVKVEPRFDYYVQNYAKENPVPVRHEGFYKYQTGELVKHQRPFEEPNADSIRIEFRDVYGKDLTFRYKEGGDPAIDWIKQRNQSNDKNYVPFKSKIDFYNRGKNGTDSQNTLFTDLLLGYTSINNTQDMATPFCLPSSTDLTKDNVLPKATFKTDPKIASAFFNFAKMYYSEVSSEAAPLTARNPFVYTCALLHQHADLLEHGGVTAQSCYYEWVDTEQNNRVRENGYWCISYTGTNELIKLAKFDQTVTLEKVIATGNNIRRGIVWAFWQTYLATVKHGSFILTTVNVSAFGISQFNNSTIYKVQIGDRLANCVVLTIKNYMPTKTDDIEVEMVEVINNRLEGETLYAPITDTVPPDSFILHLNKKDTDA